MQSREQVSEKTAEQVWDILVQSCGARADGKDSFVRHAASGSWTEYRFMGDLGFGGKVWNRGLLGGDQHFRVTYYPEDRTNFREGRAARANQELMAL